MLLYFHFGLQYQCMDCKTLDFSYENTGFFSKLVLDYLNKDEKLSPFYNEFPSDAAIGRALEHRKKTGGVDRSRLSRALQQQYTSVPVSASVKTSLELLEQETTFTVTTAHQPNLFTGPFYFIYKILHAIRLAEKCRQLYPAYNFVPVYYMGSEDADLDELGHLFISGQKMEWQTRQTGAVGRMKVDDALLELLGRIEAQIGVLPCGTEISRQLRSFYEKGVSIQEATFRLVNFLFEAYGLVVVIPDSALLKAAAIELFKDELLNSRSSVIVEATAAQLAGAGYRVQAHGREINLFYLTDEGRYRIERSEEQWKVLETHLVFSKEELLQELEKHPERFSPNVILRPVFQELILPNLLFIGGGGELAYWIQLKKIFEQYGVPYPLLVLRNSFLFINSKQAALMQQLEFEPLQLFRTLHQLKNDWITRHSVHELGVEKALLDVEQLYNGLKKQAAPVDETLLRHITALEKTTGKGILELGKKLLRAEKRNHESAMNQTGKLKDQLFPHNSLQERIENFLPFYAVYGKEMIAALYRHSLALEQRFVVLQEK
ncbi:bacillithiol biosynthesis cysteine-adding enzyme BshC [Niabella beijingensis]|uniref:bacillithiol biosynthesis cysteine-adding enzyme BshC n=1 Tax=Niabella beijingensis TaxID=2872700 RepID=UPI001CBFD093|nr:bacillithiol biosynthesis cysteine-adding enzyme BshC [Niabella beijingensis]MBZ4192400.1 bacillithiol biosynthesis cysteine-adding enzyme BshC [Niabella beijingensis]